MKGKEKNTMNSTDLIGMSKDKILMEFVQLHNSITLASSDRAREEHKKRLWSVFEIVGTDLSMRLRYSSVHAYLRQVSDGGEGNLDGK